MATGALETLVDSLGFEPVLHFRFGFGGDFAVQVDGVERAPLYVASGATAYLEYQGGEPLEMRHGDVVLLPHGGSHRVSSSLDAPTMHLDQVFALEMEQRGRAFALDLAGNNSVWSGSCYYKRDLESHPLMMALPRVLHLRADGNDLQWLGPTVALMRWMSDLQQGASVGMAEMSNVLIRHMVLEHLRGQGGPAAAPAALEGPLRDPRILAALREVHTQPAQAWSVETMASLCHMSRTAFVLRFQQQTGQPPMRYLARFRVHLAARILREERLSLDQAAERVGYSTGAVLARAYKRLFGFAPSGDLVTALREMAP